MKSLFAAGAIPGCVGIAAMAAALSKFDPRRSRYLAAITGPSRTADIERVLTIGVHGPKRLVIICVDDLDQAVSQ